MKILVCGGAGFVGSNLSNKLNEMNHEIMVVDNLKNGSASDLNKGIHFLKMDLIREDLETIDFKADVVYHLICTGLVESTLHPEVDLDTNGRTILNSLRYARKVGATFIYTSSGAVHGEVTRDELPLHENSKLEPANFYGATKLLAEHYCHIYNRDYGVPIIIFRLWNVFGYPQRINYKIGWIPVVTAFLILDEPVIFGSGEQTRDFTYVNDIIDGLIKGINYLKETKGCEVINLNGGKETSIRHLLALCDKVQGKTRAVKFGPKSQGDVPFLLSDNSKAKKVLNWAPQDFYQALEDYNNILKSVVKEEMVIEDN